MPTTPLKSTIFKVDDFRLRIADFRLTKASEAIMVSNLYLHPMFRMHVEHLAANERVSLSYQRAKLVMKTYS